METLRDRQALANLPVAELEAALAAFLTPVTDPLPDERLRRVVRLAVQGIVGSQSPVVRELAPGVARDEARVWPVAKRVDRFLANEQCGHRRLERGLYASAQHAAAADPP